MKPTILFISIAMLAFLNAKDQPKIKLSLLHDNNYKNNAHKIESEQAFELASQIFNSTEFYNAIKDLSFVYPNHCLTCETLDYSRKTRIPGKEVLQRLFKNPSALLSFNLEEGECRGPLGHTCPEWENKEHETTTYYLADSCNMHELETKYRLAVNICHEYMHFIGYCHPAKMGIEPQNGDIPNAINYRDDIAYRVGWIAYYICVEWQKKSHSLK
ncbi:hypothetical protein JN11_03927 [Mucilaginibacter frigoritolerans]|uniref:Uncharacterized protein n=1 Tax=Mucilaginibacter frigoritolerans TaxID=652788 RepID=A0A562TUD2_9SPHI|nr:hypothetical protein [Mucilaginibacter frigoritolerans]TWI96814.1 hypothetical protein JN11_03927 [Mucilaginibacter frigoritolerans]